VSTQREGGEPVRVSVIFGALMLVQLLAALDQTIVSTALPTIVGELGGLEHLSWVVTAYLLATTVVTPLYGKLGDIFGRKVVLQGATVLFLAGSALCGLARGMGELIAFRVLQGLGGGGLMVTAVAVIGDIVAPRDRGRYQGIFGAVFGVSTIVGPLIGGFFVEHLTWRWIFYVNLPVGAAALAVIAVVFRAPAERRRRQLDYAGAVVLAGALSALVLATSLGGTTLPWRSPPLLGLVVAAIVLLAGFVAVERRAAEPILPLVLFRNRVFVVASVVGLIVGLAMFGSVTYLPLYLQVVKGTAPARSGMQLAPMMGGMLLTSIASGQIISRIGRYKLFPVVGTAIMTLGLLLMSRLSATTSLSYATAGTLVLGMGMGMVMQVLVMAVQNAVAYEHLGVATSGATMFRAIGGSLGVSVFGAIFASGVHTRLGGTGVPSPAAIARVSPALHARYAEAFAAALHPVFLVAAAAAACGFALTWAMREIPLRQTVATRDGLGESFAMPRPADSLGELSRLLSDLARRENRWGVYERVAARAQLDLAPPQLWLLARLGERVGPGGGRRAITPEDLRAGLGLDLAAARAVIAGLEARGLVCGLEQGCLALTEGGGRALDRIVAVRRQALSDLLARWAPDASLHTEVRQLVDRLASALASEMPARAT
jgi:EmrB/QacA subfamily drug resistance transporter